MIFESGRECFRAFMPDGKETKTLIHETTNNHHTIDARLSHYDGPGEM